MAYSARELFARLIKCEAGGEGEDGMKAVATVVMNRVNVANGEYLRVDQGDLRNVITQPYQFTCLLSTVYGEPNPQTVWSSEPDELHYQIADWALSGNKHWGAGDSLWYMNPYSQICPVTFPTNGSGSIFNRVNQHCFYIPTQVYAST
jgi:N-acetylmuramoyl-L-alanine amidase